MRMTGFLERKSGARVKYGDHLLSMFFGSMVDMKATS